MFAGMYALSHAPQLLLYRESLTCVTWQHVAALRETCTQLAGPGEGAGHCMEPIRVKVLDTQAGSSRRSVLIASLGTG